MLNVINQCLIFLLINLMKSASYYINKFSNISADTILKQYCFLEELLLRNECVDIENLNYHCKNCINCYCCTKCNNCTNCTDCYCCDDCRDCNNCEFCKDCVVCKTCDKIAYSFMSTNCKNEYQHQLYIIDCNGITSDEMFRNLATGLINCTNCTNCYWCVGANGADELNQIKADDYELSKLFNLIKLKNNIESKEMIDEFINKVKHN